MAVPGKKCFPRNAFDANGFMPIHAQSRADHFYFD